MRKHVLIVVVAAVVALALAPGIAYANFAIHGSYTMDTDACAGCHRAHTAASSITWTKTDLTQGSALLLSTASEIYEFCYTCHDAVSLGADTNVEEGIYEGTLYGTQFDQLNGGGFEASLFPAQHMYTGASWFAYGGAVTTDLVGNLSDNAAPQIEMSCSTCHDVHGSSNYRLLKDVVNGHAVGGYSGGSADPTPTPWVSSAETGYPTIGWLLHNPGAIQVSTYTPNYTSPMYAKPVDFDKDLSPDPDKGISGWCAACHVQYIYNEGAYTSATASWEPTTPYDSLDLFGAVIRHRHPVNVPLSNYLGARSLIITAQVLPLAHDGNGDVFTNSSTDWIDCMTCHVAHGSSADMTGYADVADSTNPDPNTGGGGVPPTGDNALLRDDNRSVCEQCHNK